MPVKSTFFTDGKIEDEETIYSSFSALSQHSTVVDHGLLTVAINGKNRLLLKSLSECFEDDSDDERIGYALDDIKNKIRNYK